MADNNATAQAMLSSLCIFQAGGQDGAGAGAGMGPEGVRAVAAHRLCGVHAGYEAATGAADTPLPVDNTTSGVSDVCRLECPFTELVALIDQLHTTQDGCKAVSDAWTPGTSSHQVETAACEAVAGCYYIPEDLGDDAAMGGAAGTPDEDKPARCAPIYAACKLVAQNAAGTAWYCGTNGAAATAGHGSARVAAPPTLSGDGDLTTVADNVAACTFADVNGDSPMTTYDDTCLFTPPASAYVPITRCDALLATGWAHDLRDSCDATAACPLHGNAGDATPGMVAMLKLVYTAAGVAPDIASTSGSFTDGTQTNYFTDDGNPLSKSFWDVCTGIRDAVLAAPTCSSGAGR